MVVKTIPRAASFLSRLFWWTYPMPTVVRSPAASAPGKMPMPRRKEVAMPGRTACDTASPIRARPRRIVKLPTMPHSAPTRTEVIKALLRYSYSIRAKKNSTVVLYSAVPRRPYKFGAPNL